MMVTKSNIEDVVKDFNDVVINKLITHYSGWDKQIDPFSLKYEPQRTEYRKEHSYNVTNNHFIKIDKENNFIRLRSSEYEYDDVYNCRDYNNVIVNVGDDVVINNDIIVIINNHNVLNKIINQGKLFHVFKLN